MSKREICLKCDSPLTRCLCAIVKKPLSYPFPILVLQHPDETNHYLNTVKILKLSLTNLKVEKGEIFLPSVLDQNKNWYLLFPDLEPQKNNTLKSNEHLFNPANDGIIIIDGTWKKAKKIYFSNPFLQTLPKLMLQNFYPSEYELRICAKENHLSTLEAFTYKMDELQIGLTENFDLRQRMKEMIQKQKRLSQTREPIK